MEETLKKEDLDLDEIEMDDDLQIVMALTDFLEDKGFDVDIAKSYSDSNNEYNNHLYDNLADDSQWLVCSYEEAEDLARDYLYDMVRNESLVDLYGYDAISGYIKESYFDEMMEDDINQMVDEYGDDELISELESYGIIDDSDKELDDDVDPEEAEADDFDEDEHTHYPEWLLEQSKERLVEKMMDSYGSGIDWYLSMFGEDDLRSYISENQSYCIDEDDFVEDQLAAGDFGYYLASYDGDEHEISYEDEDGVHYLYVYRVN